MILFGAGKLIAIPTADASGNPIAVPTPVAIAVLQDVAVDFDFETKTLHGEKQFAVAVARGKAKIGWKAKSGDFDGAALGALFLGSTATTARKGAVIDFVASVPAVTTYIITIVPPSSGVFAGNLGVINALTGQALKRVASGPTTGQYSLVDATGVYTFAAADASLAVLISYEYSIASSPTSQLYNFSNPLMGYTPTFAAVFYNQYAGKTLAMKLNCNVLGKESLPFKNDDYTMIDMSADAFADAASNVGYICQY